MASPIVVGMPGSLAGRRGAESFFFHVGILNTFFGFDVPWVNAQPTEKPSGMSRLRTRTPFINRWVMFSISLKIADHRGWSKYALSVMIGEIVIKHKGILKTSDANHSLGTFGLDRVAGRVWNLFFPHTIPAARGVEPVSLG